MCDPNLQQHPVSTGVHGLKPHDWGMIGVLVTSFIWFFPAPNKVVAQTHSETTPREAVRLYLQGREHYEAGRYQEAIHDLKAALELDQNSPNLIYNVAKVSELLGNLDEAIYYYQRYLKLISDEDIEERTQIQKTLRRLEGAQSAVVSQASIEKGDLKAPAPLPPPPSSGAADFIFWSTLSTGIALLTAGVVMGILALERREKISSFVVGKDGSLEERRNIASETDTYALLSDIGIAGGSLLVVTSGLLFFLRKPNTSKNETNIGFHFSQQKKRAWLFLRGHL